MFKKGTISVLSAATFSSLVSAAAAQESYNLPELLPFPADYKCVEQVIKDELGPKTQFHQATQQRMNASAEVGDIQTSIRVNMRNKHVTELAVTISDGLTYLGEDKAVAIFNATSFATASYGQYGGIVSNDPAEAHDHLRALNFLKKVDDNLRKCAFMG